MHLKTLKDNTWKTQRKNAFFRFNLLLMLTKQKRVHSKAQIVPSWLSRWNEKLNASLWGCVAPAPTTPSLQRNILHMNLSICRVKRPEQNLRDSKWQMINDRTTGAHYPHQTHSSTTNFLLLCDKQLNREWNEAWHGKIVWALCDN